VRYTEFFFKESDVIIVTSLVLRTQSASVVFCSPLFLHNSPRLVLNNIVSYEKMKKFNKQTCLNVKH